MILSDTSIKRPVTTVMVILALVVLGAISYVRLGVDMFPDIAFPIVTVTTIYRGADPVSVEEKVSRKIEEAVNQVSGIRILKSVSIENVSQVIVVFELEKDVDVAAQEVRDKVGAASRSLPADIEQPQIEKVDLGAAPIMTVAVSGPQGMDQGELGRFADEHLREQLRQIQGVGGVDLIGFRDRAIWVYLDPSALKRHHLTASDVVQALAYQNLEVPAGTVEVPGREIAIKTKGYVGSLEELGRISIMSVGGATVRLGDVARVEDGLEKEVSRSWVNGKPAVAAVVRKQSGTNTVEMARKVKAAIPAIASAAPAGVLVEVVADSSVFIEESVRDSMKDLLIGAILAIVVIALFLRNVRMTLIAAVAIPASIVGTFAFMKAMGFTLNYLTLLGLSLSVGLLVDDAIVVLENIFRHVEKGEDGWTAASSATSEIGLAVTATTFSLVAVFGPIATTGGMVGRFLRDFGLTVVAAVLISLLVSFTVTPMLSARFVRIPRGNFFTRAVEAVLAALDRWYAALVGWALGMRALVIVAALIVLGGSVLVASTLDREMISASDSAEFRVTVDAPLGSSLDRTEAAVKDVLRTIGKVEGVRYLVTTIGGGVQARTDRASITVELTDRKDREHDQMEIMDALRARFADHRGATVAVEDLRFADLSGGRNALVQLDVRGPSLEKDQAMAERIIARMRKAGGYTDVDTTFKTGKPEIGLVPDRERAYALGIPVGLVGMTLRYAIAGDKISDYREGGEMVDVRIGLDERWIGDPETIGALEVRAPSGQLVEVRNVARIEHGEGPQSIDRQDGQRQVTILANLSGKALGEAIEELDGFAAEEVREPGYAHYFSGMGDMMEESFEDLGVALILAIIFIYFILASQFESFVHPFTIMLSLPLAVIGAFGALKLTDRTMSLLAMIGFIMLMGLVTKNAILLVDFAIQGRKRGMGIAEAVITAGRTRLRPILMTSAAMIFGMLPIAVSGSKGAEMRAPMAIGVIGGLITSTALTLVVVPVVFSLVEGARERISGRRRAPMA